MVLVLSTVQSVNLEVLQNVFEAMLNKFRVDKDIGAMRVIKGILEKIRMELALRQKKVKSDKYHLTIPSPRELSVKLKGMNRPNAQSIIEMAMKANLKENPLALQELTNLWLSSESSSETKVKSKSRIPQNDITELRRYYQIATQETPSSIRARSAKMQFARLCERLITEGIAKKEIEDVLP